MLDPKYILVQEPATPAALKRMTSQQKNWLLLQRSLEWAIEQEDVKAAQQCFEQLGFFEEAHSPLKEALKQIHCGCPPIKLEWNEGERTKYTSNYQAMFEYPQGMHYKCQTCGHDVISKNFPDSHSRQLHASRSNFPNPNQGHDLQEGILPDASTSHKTI
jgi:hypothetical protein